MWLKYRVRELCRMLFFEYDRLNVCTVVDCCVNTDDPSLLVIKLLG